MAKRGTEDLKVIESCACGRDCSGESHEAPTAQGRASRAEERVAEGGRTPPREKGE